jgi:hypothetical protein
MGIFRALIVMRMKNIRSLRELTRLLDFDLRLRRLCLIKQGQKGYGRSVLSRFIARVGADLLGQIIDEKVIKLLSVSSQNQVDVVLDASFIKAYSTRDPLNSQIGYSDPDARVGRNGKTYNLGYKLHLSIDSTTILPLTSLVVCANQNEKRHSFAVVELDLQGRMVQEILHATKEACLAFLGMIESLEPTAQQTKSKNTTNDLA